MPATPAAPNPVDAVLTESRAALESFLQTANDEVFVPQAEQSRKIALNPMSDALDKASPAKSPATQPTTDKTRGSDGRFVSQQSPQDTPPPAAQQSSPATANAAPAAIPGPPSTTQASAGESGTSPADTFSDIPAPDVLDKPGGKLNSQNWRKLHAKADTYAQQVEQLRKEMEQLRSTPPATGQPPAEVTQQLQTLQQERDALIARLEAVAVERSPRFESMFKPRQEAAIAQAKAAVGPAQAERVAALLSQPESAFRDEQLEVILQEVGASPLRSQKLMGAVAEIDRIAAERNQMAGQSQQLFKQWASEEQANMQRQQSERKQQVQSTFDRIASDWKKAVPDLDDGSLEIARDVMMGNRSIEDIAKATMWVAYGPRAAATAHKLQQENAALQAEIQRLRGVQPGVASDAGSAPATGDPVTANGLEGLIQTIAQAGILRR